MDAEFSSPGRKRDSQWQTNLFVPLMAKIVLSIKNVSFTSIRENWGSISTVMIDCHFEVLKKIITIDNMQCMTPLHCHHGDCFDGAWFGAIFCTWCCALVHVMYNHVHRSTAWHVDMSYYHVVFLYHVNTCIILFVRLFGEYWGTWSRYQKLQGGLAIVFATAAELIHPIASCKCERMCRLAL